MNASAPAAKNLSHILLAGLGAFCAIGVLGFLKAWTETALVLGSFGASCVLLFGFPESPFSQPCNIIGGHFLSSLTGLVFIALFGPDWIALAAAAACAVMLMIATRTVHPPAGSNPVIVFLLGTPDWRFLLFPTLSGVVVLVCVGWFYWCFARPKTWPKAWL